MVGFIAAVIFLIVNWNSKKGDKTVNAVTYVAGHKPEFTVMQDRFLRKSVVTHKIETNTSSGGGGGHSGGGGGGGSHAKYYDIKVNGGKALNILGNEVNRASSGSVIDVQADAPAEGKVFKGWEVVQGGINAGETSEFSFIMPRADVELAAVYEDTAVEEPVIEEPEDPAEPEQPDEDVEEQPEEKDETPVPKTGDAMTMELFLFAVLAAGAAFGMKKAYNKTK